MIRRSGLRASDLDRERVAERLRHATAEGRLTAGELEDRLEVALSARTYGQLDFALSDLPAVREDRVAVPLWVRASLGVAGAVGVVAAAAMAAMLFALVACLSAAWMVVSRAMSSRTGQQPRASVLGRGSVSGAALTQGKGGSRRALTRRERPGLLR